MYQEDLSKPVLVCISGGGMTQIENALGVIKAIRATRYRMFDEMMGTSAGAIASAIYMSLGQDVDKFDKAITGSKVSDWFAIRPIEAIKSLFGLSNYVADDTKFKNYLLETITPSAVEKVKVAITDMGKYGEEMECKKSLLVPALPQNVLASMSFQKIFPPVVMDGEMYADGGINNLCPLPTYMDFQKYSHVYIILASPSPLFPKIKWWPFMSQILNIIDKTMDRELAQIKEFRLDELPNVTVFSPETWVESANFLHWSDNFEQVEASYQYALDVLNKEG